MGGLISEAMSIPYRIAQLLRLRRLDCVSSDINYRHNTATKPRPSGRGVLMIKSGKRPSILNRDTNLIVEASRPTATSHFESSYAKRAEQIAYFEIDNAGIW